MFLPYIWSLYIYFFYAISYTECFTEDSGRYEAKGSDGAGFQGLQDSKPPNLMQINGVGISDGTGADLGTLG